MRAASLCVALLLVLTLVPAPAAAEDVCQPGPCRVVGLYVLANGGSPSPLVRLLSSLPGDAMPSDPGTHTSGAIEASTRELTAGLVIMKDGAFRVNLTSPVESPSYVNGSLRVFAIDLAGNSFTLAERVFTTPQAPPMQQALVDSVNATLNATMAAPPQQADLIVDTFYARAADTYTVASEAFGAEGYAQGANGEVYRAICGSPAAWSSNQCAQLTGRLGTGQVTPCAGSPPLNLFGTLAWTAVHTVDPIQSGVTGRSLCASTFDDANETAVALDDTVGPDESPFPEFPSRDALHFENPAAPPPDWKDVTLDASPPGWLPQDDASFTLPAGMRLALRVSLSASTRSPEGHWVNHPLPLEVGHPEAATALHIRTTTPGAFAAFAYDAAPILPGRHTGVFATATDADDFTFTAPAGSTIRVANAGSIPLTFHLFDENGVAQRGASVTAPAAPGAWTLRAARNGTTSTAIEYAFILETTMPATPDEGGEITAGQHAGELSGTDTIDSYTFWVDRAQRFNLSLHWGASASLRLVVQENTWDTTSSTGANDATFSGRATRGRMMTLNVVRDWGETSYELTLERDAGGNLSSIPSFVSVTLPEGLERPRELQTFDDGVAVGFLEGESYHLTDAGWAEIPDAGGRRVARTADGSLVRVEENTVVLGEGPSETPLVRTTGEFAFGGDGALYANRYASIVRLEADRSEATYGAMEHRGIMAMPSGEIVLSRRGASDQLVPSAIFDPLNGTFVPAPAALSSVAAFDAEGRSYRVLNLTVVERFDPMTGRFEVVAHAGSGLGTLRVDALAVGHDGLYAIIWNSSIGGWSLARADLDATPFAGFSPAFIPSPAPDLVPVSAVDVVEGVSIDNGTPGEYHRLDITIANQGTGDARATRINIAEDCNCFQGLPGIVVGNWPFEGVGAWLPVPSIPGGGSAVVSLRWYASGHVGDQRFDVWVDYYTAPDDVVESDETNNFASFDTYVLIQGTNAACEQVADGIMDNPDGTSVLCRVARV